MPFMVVKVAIFTRPNQPGVVAAISGPADTVDINDARWQAFLKSVHTD